MQDKAIRVMWVGGVEVATTGRRRGTTPRLNVHENKQTKKTNTTYQQRDRWKDRSSDAGRMGDLRGRDNGLLQDRKMA